MKHLTAIALLALTGCAETSVRDSSGHVRFRTQADAQEVLYTDGAATLHIIGLNHSGPTLAGGNAFSQSSNAVTGGVATDVLAAGASSLFKKGASAGTSKVLLPGAATVGSQVASKPSTPAKATPAPVVVPRLTKP